MKWVNMTVLSLSMGNNELLALFFRETISPQNNQLSFQLLDALRHFQNHRYSGQVHPEIVSETQNALQSLHAGGWEQRTRSGPKRGLDQSIADKSVHNFRCHAGGLG